MVLLCENPSSKRGKGLPPRSEKKRSAKDTGRMGERGWIGGQKKRVKTQTKKKQAIDKRLTEGNGEGRPILKQGRVERQGEG